MKLCQQLLKAKLRIIEATVILQIAHSQPRGPIPMPPAPTDLLNEDIKELKIEVRDLRSDLNVVKADVHRIDVGLAELRAEFSLAKWLPGLTLVTIIGGIVSGVWGASKINTKVESLATRFDRYEAKADARFDRLEASIAKILEQTRPKTP